MVYQSSENPEEFLRNLKQNKSLPRKFTSKEYRNIRPSLLEWMDEIKGLLNLREATLYSAVDFIDLAVEKCPFLLDKLQLFSVTCLILASKARELDDKIPFLEQVKKATGSLYSIDDFKTTEPILLCLLNWDLSSLHLLDNVSYFLAHGAVFTSDIIRNNLEDFDMLETSSNSELPLLEIGKGQKAEEIAREFEQTSMEAIRLVYKDDEILSKYDCHNLACALIAYIRFCFDLSPIW